MVVVMLEVVKAKAGMVVIIIVEVVVEAKSKKLERY